MKKILIIVILTLTVNVAFSQYVWTNAKVYLKTGKTLDGQATIPMAIKNTINFSKEKLKFRINKKAKKTKYELKNIDSVIFTIKYIEKVKRKKIERTRIETYIPIFLNKKQTKQGFAQLIVDGKLRLVGRTVSYQSPGTWDSNHGVPNTAPIYRPGLFMESHNQVMFLKKGEKPEVFNQISITKSFRKRSMKYFEDCPSLKSKLEKKEFVKEDLQDIVKYYNTKCN